MIREFYLVIEESERGVWLVKRRVADGVDVDRMRLGEPSESKIIMMDMNIALRIYGLGMYNG